MKSAFLLFELHLQSLFRSWNSVAMATVLAKMFFGPQNMCIEFMITMEILIAVFINTKAEKNHAMQQTMLRKQYQGHTDTLI